MAGAGTNTPFPATKRIGGCDMVEVITGILEKVITKETIIACMSLVMAICALLYARRK